MKPLNLLFILPLLILLASCNTDPKVQSARYLSNGNKYYERGKYKEASIMYRRALQKNMKNPEAWHQLGLINLKLGSIGESRGDFIRVIDLAEADHRFDATVEDSIAKTADLDYTLYTRDPNRFKELLQDLRRRALLLQQNYAKSYNAYRVTGLTSYAEGVTVREKPQRREFVEKALNNFLEADKIKPYDAELGFAIINTLAEAERVPEAEKYAKEMIARKTTDDRVYDLLYMYYLRSGRAPEAEEVRKQRIANDPKNGMNYVKLAGHYYLTRRQPEMLATLARITSDLKTFPNAYMLTGDFYLAANNVKSAITQYEQGVKVDTPNKALYLKKTAECYTLINQPKEAAKVVAELLKLNPNDPEAIAMSASLQLNSAKPADADRIIAQLQPLLTKTAPTDKERSTLLHFNLGRAYAIKGDTQSMDQARLHFQEAANLQTQRPYLPAVMALSQLELQRGENPQAVDHATAILTIDPTNLNARLVRTMGLMNMGEQDKARQELETILKLKPDSTDARFQLARLNVLQKKYAEGEVEFEALRKVNDPRGLAGIIETRVQQGKTGEAIQLLQDELTRNPANYLYRNALATLEFNVGKYKDAINEFGRIINDNPNADAKSKEDWHLRLGESYRQSGDLGSAIAEFNKAGEIAPKHAVPRLELAMLLDTTGKSSEAHKVYEEVLKMEPDNAIALNNLAYAKADSGTDLDQALTYAQRARTKNPQDPNILDTLGLIYYKKDLIDDSLRLFGELVNRSPASPTFHLHLAMALYKKGDKSQAKRELDLARRNRPNDREQAQINDLISKIG